MKHLRYSFLILLLPVALMACTKWEHRWQILDESWESNFQAEAAVALQVALPQVLGDADLFLLPASSAMAFPEAGIQTHPWKSDEPFPQTEELKGLPPFKFVVAATPLLNQAHHVVAVDESLPMLSLAKVEDLHRSTLRWVKLDASGNPVTLDETSVYHGFTITVSTMPRWWPILRVERFLGAADAVASHSWIEGMVPQDLATPPAVASHSHGPHKN